MKNELNQALHIIQIVMLCVLAFIYADATERRKVECMEMQAEISEVKDEIAKLQDELKHNNNIVLKVLEKEW